ncbi:hypothetical protein D3C87_1419790 [compost metagenome]
MNDSRQGTARVTLIRGMTPNRNGVVFPEDYTVEASELQKLLEQSPMNLEPHPFGTSYSIVSHDDSESLRTRSVLHSDQADPQGGAGGDT